METESLCLQISVHCRSHFLLPFLRGPPPILPHICSLYRKAYGGPIMGKAYHQVRYQVVGQLEPESRVSKSGPSPLMQVPLSKRYILSLPLKKLELLVAERIRDSGVLTSPYKTPLPQGVSLALPSLRPLVLHPTL